MQQINCKTCDESFVPKSEKNIFCSRKCFKKDFYRRKKNEVIEITFPDFICKSCNNKAALNFDPIENPEIWLKFRCPNCSVLFINVVDTLSAEDEALFGK